MPLWIRMGLAGWLVAAGPLQQPDPAPPAAAPETGAAQAVDFEAVWDAAAADLVERLRTHAQWCRENKLFADRERALEELLWFASEDREAHLALRHRLQRDGTWLVPLERKPTKNATGSPEAASADRRAAVIRAFTTRVFEAVERCAAELPPERRLEVHTRILALDPDHEGVHRLRGEVPLDGGWVLAETVRAHARRAELEAIVAQSFGEVGELEPLTVLEKERALGLPWKSTARTANVRVLSTGEAAACERMARATQATIATFHRVMGAEERPFPVLTVYVLATPEERDRFITEWPAWGPSRLADLSLLAGSGMIGSLDVARWDESEAQRLDGAVRHVIGTLLQREYRIGVDVPWAWEGIGLYLTRALVGTRLTWYGTGVASPDASYRGFIHKVMEGQVNWINEGYVRLRSPDGPHLADVLAKTLPELDIFDFLAAYAFAAYLIEARPDDLPRLLERLGREPRARPAALADVLGAEPAALERRLVRWLGERR